LSKYSYLLAAILLAGCWACQSDPEPTAMIPTATYFPPLLGSTWETVDPADLGWDTAQLPDVQGFLDNKNTKAFIILKNGRIAMEWYFDNFNQDSVWYWASAGKTLTAFMIGLAQEKGQLSINDPTSDYLGSGWTSLDTADENMITIRHQLTMTSGLDDGAGDVYCTTPSCLQKKTAPGTRWAYHNAPYTLLGNVIETASGKTRNQFLYDELATKIGMGGLFIKSGYNYVYYSKPRSMARFGLLMLENGDWDGVPVMKDKTYLQELTNTSQDINPSYGYLWWLNGKGKHMLPATQLVFNTDLIPNAPADVAAALGKNDQKIYLYPSRDIVVIRMGHDAGQSMLALSSFDNELWGHLTDLFN